MTYEEAKKSILDMCCWCNDDAECIYYSEKRTDLCEECEFYVALKCIEKQIREKPLRYIDLDRVGYSAWCPVCEGPVERGKGCSNNDCRQAIDWSEEE